MMMRRPRPGLFLLSAALSIFGCTSGPPTYAAMPTTAPFAQAAPGYQGMLPVNVTTQTRMPEVRDTIAGRGLIEGAQCVAQTSAFRLTFTTPARITVPDYGQASPPIKVTCTRGTLTGQAQIIPQDVSHQVRHLDALIKPRPRWIRPLLERHRAGGPQVWTYRTVAVVLLAPA